MNLVRWGLLIVCSTCLIVLAFWALSSGSSGSGSPSPPPANPTGGNSNPYTEKPRPDTDPPPDFIAIAGTIVASDTGAPISGVTIQMAYPGTITPIRSTKSGPDGAFWVTLPAEGPYRISATADGFLQSTTEARAPFTGLTIELEPNAGFFLSLSRANPLPSEIAEQPACLVTLLSLNGDLSVQISAAEGSTVLVASFPAGVRILAASPEGILGEKTFTARQGAIIDLKVGGMVPIQGVVLAHPDGTPLEGVLVSVLEYTHGTSTDQDGKFLIYVPANSAYILLEKPGFRTHAIYLWKAGTDREPVIARMRREHRLSVRVQSSGQPISGATVLVHSRTLRSMKPEVSPLKTDAGGVVEVSSPPVGGQCNLFIVAEGYESAWAPVLVSGEQQVVIELSPSPSLQVRVQSEHGIPVAGAQVLLTQRSETEVPDFHCSKGRTDENGVFEFSERASPGSDLLVQAEGYAPETIALDGLPRGEPTTVTLGRAQALRVRVLDSEGKALPYKSVGIFVLSKEDKTTVYEKVAVSREDGVVEFDGIPNVEYVDRVYVLNDKSSGAHRSRVVLGMESEVVLVAADAVETSVELEIRIIGGVARSQHAFICLQPEEGRSVRRRLPVSDEKVRLTNLPKGNAEIVLLTEGGVARMPGIPLVATTSVS